MVGSFSQLSTITIYDTTHFFAQKKAPAKEERRRLMGGHLLNAHPEVFEQIHPGASKDVYKRQGLIGAGQDVLYAEVHKAG